MKNYINLKTISIEKNLDLHPHFLYPNEMLVKICSSKNYSKLTSGLFNRKIKVCEIGCFAGNNLRFFADKGYDVSGIEINQYLIKICKSYLKKFG